MGTASSSSLLNSWAELESAQDRENTTLLYGNTKDTEHFPEECDSKQSQELEPKALVTRKEIAIFLAALTIVNLAAFNFLILMIVRGSMPSANLSPVTLDDLPFQSTFVGFDDLYDRLGMGNRNASASLSRGPMTNIPRVLLQLDASNPTKYSPLWTEKWVTDGGMVPYRERRMIVTQSISTFAEFHVMDYGMKNCSVSLAFPGAASSMSSTPTYRLDIWKLDWNSALDHHQLTWINRPQRKERLGSFIISSTTRKSTQELEGYLCESGTYQILEVTCGAGACDLDVASGQEAQGLFMRQGVYA
ncbi:hypothetical protein D9613_001181 [Agrocybe pediades]|uniref:Ubiquitin 3 binding protein But2 C-terminal domain-containing protein n=1 Tax=Agrocybe pediades TaxID=84607 RepID=A0A8H4R0Z7_9AGAR|nr:hypothetical protein D9613_001181 [Agrocybe pediades]